MAHNSKEQETLPANLAKVEAALKTRIEKIEQLDDPVDQLLQYKDLLELNLGKTVKVITKVGTKDVAKDVKKQGTYDENKVLPWTSRKESSGDAMGDGAKYGFWTGFWVGAIVGLIVGIVTANPALGAILFGALTAGGIPSGIVIGRKAGQSRFDKSSPKQKHATRMNNMTNDISEAMKVLERTLKREKSLEIVERSPHRQQALKEFPDLAEAFEANAKRRDGIAAAQAALLNQAAVITPAKKLAITQS